MRRVLLLNSAVDDADDIVIISLKHPQYPEDLRIISGGRWGTTVTQE